MDAVKYPTRNDSIKNLNSTSLHITEPTSLSTVIVWNISKAIEKSPTLNIKEAVNLAQSRLDQISDAGDIQTILSDSPYERHLACALLAWQQLGHRDADSLCRFVENKRKKEECPSKLSSNEPFDIESLSQTSKDSKIISKIVSGAIGSTSRDSESRYEEAQCYSSYNSFAMGPVVKLPVETKVVMRLDNTPRGGRSGGQPRKTARVPEKDIIRKIDQACCMDSACAERLAALDAMTSELRARAGTLARREAERVELLERAEAAWKDLELGYQRRFSVAEEKEEDIAKQITKMLEERVNYKNACTILVQELKDRSGRAEIERTRLSELEKQVCERACQRMRVSEESAKGDAMAAELSCKAAQLDRDLQFKEEQARRNMMNLQSEVAAMRALSCEAERVTRSELGALRDQIAEVSNKLLDEDAQNAKTKSELEELRQEKMEIIEDLEGCKALCDGQMQGKMDNLNKKRDQLAKLREKVMECRCKVPVNIAVEAKRTPSLAALCKCTPEDKILECCSCTSMRTKLLSNLFADLFGGLQSELRGAVTLMPCQLLKCLEDKHNWDRASVVKSNLKNYFSKLLVGELDIAIATSIENYHAKWVGISCADAIKMTPGPEDDTDTEGWQERAIERRAQSLAEQLAEQLFQERAEELTQRARDIVQAGPPPCECDLKAKLPEGCTCGTKPSAPTPTPDTETQVYWHQAMQDVTQLRLQVEDLKKDSLKRDDLKTMEDRFEKFIQLSSVGGPPERDLHDLAGRKCTKKTHGRATTHGGGEKKNDEIVKNASARDSTACSCVVKQTTAPVPPEVLTPLSWQQAMQDVTLLRFEIEDLKKESIKKEDLKMMKDKITKIIHRASGSTASTSPKIKYGTDENLTYGTNKYSKINRHVNQSGLRLSDIEKPKKKMFGSIAKEKVNPILNRGINKPYKKKIPTYSVNVCLCSTKRQEQKELNKRRKLETSTWKTKFSKDTVSQMSSSIRQSKPINNSFLSQDISARTYSKEYEEKSCPSNCVCFHKIPSTTSIDKLLETLARWKSDLDASFTEKYPDNISCCHFSKYNFSHPLIENTTFESITSLKSKEKSEEMSIRKRQDLLSNQASDDKIGLEPSQTKMFEKRSLKSTGPVTTNDSVYMGAVNLDKSHEELCKCEKNTINKKTPFKCIASNKCSCEKTLEVKKMEGQLMHVKKEKFNEINVIRAKQERRVKEIIALPDTPKNNETNKILTSEKETNYRIADEKTNARAFKTSDYQINFLGVTLVDVNPKTKNQMLLESGKSDYKNKNAMTNNSVLSEKYHSDLNETDQKIERNQQNYSILFDRPELTNYTNSIEKKKRNIFINNENEDANLKCFINNNNKIRKEICETYHENESTHENCNNHAMLLSYTEESNLCQLNRDIHYKNSDLGYKTASDQNTSNVGCDNNRCDDDNRVNAGAKNSHVSEISKKSYKTASENNELFDEKIGKISSRTVNSSEKTIKKKQSSSFDLNTKTVCNPQMQSCQCSMQLDEFKKFINANFMKRTANEDVALDVQSLKYFKERDGSCVCCSKLNSDDCNDLEDNTFHLIEEYLKNKLDVFRASTCSSYCIPAEEEEKIFSIIVERVKRLISDSTNQIACKCSTEEGKSQGSWNRAYGLLQEYLKIKIKKVQCSCLLAEDNKDTILPDVLEKISNLIEYDFRRLKNICSCANDQNTQETNKAKQDNFEAPEKDQNAVFQTNFSKFAALDDQIGLSAYENIQSNYLKQSSQLPMTLEMEDEPCDLQEINGNNFDTNISMHSLHKHNKCGSCLNNTNVKLLRKDLTESEKNIEVSSSNTNCTKETGKARTVLRSDFTKIDSLLNKPAKKTNVTNKLKCNEQIEGLSESRSHPSNSVKIIRSIKSKGKQKPLSSSCNRICRQKSIDSIKNLCLQENKVTRTKQKENPIKKSRDVPYFGYTISCSCDETLGPCVCPKNIANMDPGMINDILKKSIPDEEFFEKISYILHKQPEDQNANLLEMSNEADPSCILKNKPATNNRKSEATSCNKLEPIVLKTSKYDIVKSHAETNTFKDNASLDTDCSNNEDVDWCECTSQLNPSKHTDRDRLKRSIYFPAPVEDIDGQPKDDISYEHISDGHHKHVCDCERVPLCHIKMLIENIETKLANANCTCDSLIPKVCPVHSTMC